MSNPRQYVVVCYPGCVVNVDRAVQTLGGLQKMWKSHTTTRRMELNYCPENPYCSTLTAEGKTLEKSTFATGKVLAVAKIRRRKSNPKEVKSEILGVVNTVYVFSALYDFQFLPIRRINGNVDQYEDMMPRLIPQDVPSAMRWLEQSDEPPGTPLFLPPYHFSRFMVPSTKILSKEDVNSKCNRGDIIEGQSLRPERKSLTISVLGTDEFPKAVSEEAVRDAEARCKSQEMHNALAELFENRPLWTRAALCFKTGFEEITLRVLLPKFAFYIASGAWGRCWCRFGYDPRIDPTSKMYQTVMISFRQHAQISEKPRLKFTGLLDKSALAKSTQDGSRSTDFAYISGKLPPTRQMWYCICDILLPIADEVVRKQYFTRGDCADPQSGWIPMAVIDRIREEIKYDVSKVSKQLDDHIENDSPSEFGEDEWR